LIDLTNPASIALLTENVVAKTANLVKATAGLGSSGENGRAKPSPLALKQIEDLIRGLGERGQDLLQEFFAGEER